MEGFEVIMRFMKAPNTLMVLSCNNVVRHLLCNAKTDQEQ